jgi:hypothetical protein
VFHYTAKIKFENLCLVSAQGKRLLAHMNNKRKMKTKINKIK